MQVNFNQDNVCNPLNSLGDPFKLLSIIIHYCVCECVVARVADPYTHTKVATSSPSHP